MRKPKMRTWFVSVAGLVAALGVIDGTIVADDGSSTPSPETFTLVGTTTRTSHHVVDLPARAKTRVTMRVVERGFRYEILGGLVQSTRPSRCAEDRTVVVLRQDGREQDPRTDLDITADRTSSRGVWRTRLEAGNDHDGRLYAKVSRTEFCRADTSRTIHVSIPG